MTLSAGARLGPYEIVSPLGAGGMGEVYRAKDTRLDREVAVKVLPEHLTGSAELRSRFEREARAISSLSHPNICTLYDVGREGETDFLVMELLDGESLLDRLAKGPIPVDEVLRLGIQITDALERAHASGIVHRDLKPGNIFVTERGVKILDFGLAKLHAAAQQTSKTALGALPTEQLSVSLTGEGMILGTFQYMSPEQLEGKEADPRTDIFALGAVLYEMATGKKAFAGSSQASLIGSIMHSTPPPVSALAALAPPALDRVIATCLAKDPKDRWSTAHDLKLQLAWIAEGGSQIGVPAPVAARRKHREKLAWALAAAATLVAAATTVGYLRRAPKPERVLRFDIQQPQGLVTAGEPKLSPDGRNIAFVGVDEKGQSQVWLRSLDTLEARPLAGTEGIRPALRPFWSPDSKMLAFVADGKMKKVSIDGGPVQKICDAPTGADGTWSEDGAILFDGQTGDPIQRVPAAGGIAKPVVTGKENGEELVVGWPQFLPGGKRFLYVAFGKKNEIRIADADGSHSRKVIDDLSRVEYAPPGDLVYVRDTTLVAQHFDVAKGALSGDPVPIADGIGVDANGMAEFSVSRGGVIVYRAGTGGGVQLVWLDRHGTHVGAPIDSGEIYNPDLSRDGRWLVVERTANGGDDIWMRDLERGVSSRLTFLKGDEWAPLFSPDGKKVFFSRDDGDGGRTIVVHSLDSGEETDLHKSKVQTFPVSISPDGKTLLFSEHEKKTSGWDLWTMPAGGGEPSPWVVTPGFTETQASISPDGRWAAFRSNQSGKSEIYVQPFPHPGRQWQVSTSGGIDPHWSPKGNEIFYVAADGELARVEVKPGAGFDAGIPEFLFPIPLAPQVTRNRFLVSNDAQRFLVVAPAGAGQSRPMTVVVGWDVRLKP